MLVTQRLGAEPEPEERALASLAFLWIYMLNLKFKGHGVEYVI